MMIQLQLATLLHSVKPKELHPTRSDPIADGDWYQQTVKELNWSDAVLAVAEVLEADAMPFDREQFMHDCEFGL